MTNELAVKPMSYEKMIDTLKGLVFGTFDRTTSKEREALGRAIDLLSNSDEDCISREEVCDYIAEFVNHEYATDREHEMVEHIIGGIQHLPSIQPKPIEGDAISRKAVLDGINQYIDKAQSGGVIDAFISFETLVVKDLPSIQPKQKTDEPMQVELEGDGMWNGEIVYDYGKCPKCGWEFEYGEKDWEEPYCCHCGQRLKWFESEDEE